MSKLDELSLDEVEATMARLRARKQELMQTNKTMGRRIVALAKRRERLIERANELDDQILALRAEVVLATPSAPVIRRRGRRPKTEV